VEYMGKIRQTKTELLIHGQTLKWHISFMCHDDIFIAYFLPGVPLPLPLPGLKPIGCK